MNPPPIPDSYALLNGAVLGASKRAIEVRAEAFQAAGYTALLSLQELNEAPGFVRPTHWKELLIRDFHAPSFEQAQRICEQMDTWRAEGRGIVVHCTAGCGRTGTVLAAYLIWHGADASSAVASVRAAAAAARFGGTIVETTRQHEFLADWAAAVGAGKIVRTPVQLTPPKN